MTGRWRARSTRQENIAQGYRQRGIGWYRRYLRVDEAERGRHFELQFDAIATHAQIWVNGQIVQIVQRSGSGYTASNLGVTSYLRCCDAVNTVASRADADAMEGWWYEGAGIYHHASLLKRNAVHVATDVLLITPEPLEMALFDSGKAAAKGVSVEITVADPQDSTAAQRSCSLP